MGKHTPKFVDGLFELPPTGFKGMRAMSRALRDLAKDYDIALMLAKTPGNPDEPHLALDGMWLTWHPVERVDPATLRLQLVKARSADNGCSVGPIHFNFESMEMPDE